MGVISIRFNDDEERVIKNLLKVKVLLYLNILKI